MQEDDREYYVVFRNSELKGLQWLKKGFQHCAVVRKEYGTVWTVIQDGYSHLSIHPFLVEDYPTLDMLFGEDSSIIQVEMQTEGRYRGHLCVFTCVEVVKAVLGIKKPFIFTPHQLYRYLYERSCRPRKRCEARNEATKARSVTSKADSKAREG